MLFRDEKKKDGHGKSSFAHPTRKNFLLIAPVFGVAFAMRSTLCLEYKQKSCVILVGYLLSVTYCINEARHITHEIHQITYALACNESTVLIRCVIHVL